MKIVYGRFPTYKLTKFNQLQSWRSRENQQSDGLFRAIAYSFLGESIRGNDYEARLRGLSLSPRRRASHE